MPLSALPSSGGPLVTSVSSGDLSVGRLVARVHQVQLDGGCRSPGRARRTRSWCLARCTARLSGRRDRPARPPGPGPSRRWRRPARRHGRPRVTLRARARLAGLLRLRQRRAAYAGDLQEAWLGVGGHDRTSRRLPPGQPRDHRTPGRRRGGIAATATDPPSAHPSPAAGHTRTAVDTGARPDWPNWAACALHSGMAHARPRSRSRPARPRPALRTGGGRIASRSPGLALLVLARCGPAARRPVVMARPVVVYLAGRRQRLKLASGSGQACGPGQPCC